MKHPHPLYTRDHLTRKCAEWWNVFETLCRANTKADARWIDWKAPMSVGAAVSAGNSMQLVPLTQTSPETTYDICCGDMDKAGVLQEI